MSSTGDLSYGDVLIGATHHGDEHVEKDDDHDARIDAEHQQADEHGECVFLVDLKGLQIDQAKGAPEERLQRFEEAKRHELAA